MMKLWKKVLLMLLMSAFVLSGCKGPADEPDNPDQPDNPDKPIIDTTVPDLVSENAPIGYQNIPVPNSYDEISESILYKTFYFDSDNGKDANDGLSKNSPKKSIGEANRIIENAVEETPTKLLFKAGSYFSQTLKVLSFGAKKESPLIIDVYDVTNTEKYAKISSTPNCVEVSGSNVRISGLELFAPTAQRGFYVYTTLSGMMSDVVIKDNYIHDINFLWEDLSEGNRPQDVLYSTINPNDICPSDRYIYQYSGIYFTASTNKFPGASWFENVWIQGNNIERVSRAGIFINSDWVRRPGLEWGNNRYHNDETGWYPHQNFNVLNNNISYAGGDSIVVIAVNGGYIHGNTSYHAQYLGRGGYYSAGIWSHSSKNLIFQYNEAAYTHLPSGTGDGQGFDIDIGNSNILFQYNYSHNNQGGGILLCNRPSEEIIYNADGTFVMDEDKLPVSEKRHSNWETVVIRNNVFVDNGDATFHIQGKIEKLSIENNTIIIPGENSEQGIVKSNAWGDGNITGKDWRFVNNIFALRQKRASKFELDFCPDAVVENNVFYNFEDTFLTQKVKKHTNSHTYNPGLDMRAEAGLANMAAFIPSESKCLESGIILKRMTSADFAQNLAKDIKYVGAFCAVKK